jgi:hypothetical protein
MDNFLALSHFKITINGSKSIKSSIDGAHSEIKFYGSLNLSFVGQNRLVLKTVHYGHLQAIVLEDEILGFKLG